MLNRISFFQLIVDHFEKKEKMGPKKVSFGLMR